MERTPHPVYGTPGVVTAAGAVWPERSPYPAPISQLSQRSPFAEPPPNALLGNTPHNILPIAKGSAITRFTSVIPAFKSKTPSDDCNDLSEHQIPYASNSALGYHSQNGHTTFHQESTRVQSRAPSQAAINNQGIALMDIDASDIDTESDYAQKAQLFPQLNPPPRASRDSSPAGSEVSDGDPPGYFPPPNQPEYYDEETREPGRRAWEELEDINFASPKSFTSMAFNIAATRNMSLVITDDRTHKVTSAYMHVCCSHRRSGCPFILKLTKAKEGGWFMKSARSTDVENKQRSMYRCRHGGANGQIADSRAPYRPNSLPPKGLKRKSMGSEPAVRAPGRPPGNPAMERQRQRELSEGSGRGYDELAYTPPPERILAPPFERSMALLTQIEPVLTPSTSARAMSDFTGAGSVLKQSMYADPRLPYPRPPVLPDTADEDGILVPRRFSKQSGKPLPLYYDPPPFSKLPPAPPNCLPQWTAFLTLLDPELIFLAPLLASRNLGVTPTSFFDEAADVRLALMNGLEIGEWHRIKLKAKIETSGESVWASIKEMYAPKRSASTNASETSGEGEFIKIRPLVKESLEEVSSPASIPSAAASTVSTPMVHLESRDTPQPLPSFESTPAPTNGSAPPASIVSTPIPFLTSTAPPTLNTSYYQPKPTSQSTAMEIDRI